MKSRIKYALLIVLCVTMCQMIAAKNVLIIGSTQPFSTEGGVKPLNEGDVVRLVKSSIGRHVSASGGLNVVFEDIYRTAQLDTAYGGGGKIHKMDYRCHSLAQWFFWPEGRQKRLKNLQGKSEAKWDFIVLVGDAYLIAQMPGIYAEGVNLIADVIRQSDAHPLLLLPWSNNRTTAGLTEVVCRVGMSARINVIPLSTSRAVMREISAPFDNQNPFAMKYVTERKITYNHTGTSSERGIEGAIKRTVARCGIEARRANKKVNDQNITFNYGRGNSHFEKPKQYKVDPGLFDRSYGFPMQDHSASAPITMLYGIDKRFFSEGAPEDGTDLGIAWDMIRQKEIPKDIRCIPIRLMWAKLHDLDPEMKPLGDRWHMNRYLDDASATFMYTLLSGRCPIGDMPDKSDTNAWRGWLGQKVGYETAWRMSHLTTRVPGFTVQPIGNNATVQSKASTKLSVKLYYKPTETVTVRIITDKPEVATAEPKYLTFTPDNHSTEQIVTVDTLMVKADTQIHVKCETRSKDAVFTGLHDTWAYTVKAPAPEK